MKSLNRFSVTVAVRGRGPMYYSTDDKQDAERFANYYRGKKYKYPSVKLVTL